MTTTEIPTPRSTGLSYQELLDTDSHPVPDVLRWHHRMAPGPDFVPVEPVHLA